MSHICPFWSLYLLLGEGRTPRRRQPEWSTLRRSCLTPTMRRAELPADTARRRCSRGGERPHCCSEPIPCCLATGHRARGAGAANAGGELLLQQELPRPLESNGDGDGDGARKPFERSSCPRKARAAVAAASQHLQRATYSHHDTETLLQTGPCF